MIVVFTIGSDVARAHTVYEPSPEDYQWVYNNEPFCTKARVEISHGNGNGYQKVDVWSLIYDYYAGPGSPAPCFLSWNRPPHNLRVTWELWRYRDPGPAWYFCNSLGYWAENSTTTYTLQNWVAYATPPCGVSPAFGSWFTTGGGGYVFYNTWNGGWISSSGYHWLPTTPS